MKAIRFAVLIVAVAVGFSFAFAATPKAKIVQFPSDAVAVSPNGRFAVVNVDSDVEPHHTLFLEDRAAKTRRKLMEYGRSVEVLWSPDGKSIAVTDYAGSNVAECLVFSTREGEPVNVGDAVEKSITSRREREAVLSGGHVYWAAVQWASSRTLVVKVFGHTDTAPSREFKYFHAFRLVESK